MKTFEYIVVEAAEKGKPQNGNNGNYDEVAIFFDGHFITTNFVSDFTRNTKTFVKTNTFDTTYEIVDGRVIEYFNEQETDITSLILEDNYSPYNINEDVRQEIDQMNQLYKELKEVE